jgi:hypothetical protein
MLTDQEYKQASELLASLKIRHMDKRPEEIRGIEGDLINDLQDAIEERDASAYNVSGDEPWKNGSSTQAGTPPKTP